MGVESIESLRVFVQVVESGGLSAAGRVLGLAPTLVSRRISRLEDELGVRLLVRTTRSLNVTDEGAEFYRRARAILQQLEEAEAAVRPLPGKARGRVRAVLPTLTASTGILDAIAELLDAHPELELQVSFSDQPVDLVAGGWDVALHVGPLPDSTHVVRHVTHLSPVLAATPEYLARAGIPAVPADLSQHQCLRFISTQPQETWTLLRDDGRVEVVPVRGRFESDNSAALGHAMYAHMGIGIRTPGVASRGIEAGELVHVLPRWRMQPFTLSVLVPAGRKDVPRIRVFSDWLDAYCRATA